VLEIVERAVPDVAIDNGNIWVLPLKGTELSSTNAELPVSCTFKEATDFSFF
jgi:hypothetical protein